MIPKMPFEDINEEDSDKSTEPRSDKNIGKLK